MIFKKPKRARMVVEGRVGFVEVTRMKKSRRWLAKFVIQPDDPALPIMKSQLRGNTAKELKKALYHGAHVRAECVVRAAIVADVVSITSINEPIRCSVAK